MRSQMIGKRKENLLNGHAKHYSRSHTKQQKSREPSIPTHSQGEDLIQFSAPTSGQINGTYTPALQKNSLASMIQGQPFANSEENLSTVAVKSTHFKAPKSTESAKLMVQEKL